MEIFREFTFEASQRQLVDVRERTLPPHRHDVERDLPTLEVRLGALGDHRRRE